jgi:GTP-binding protein
LSEQDRDKASKKFLRELRWKDRSFLVSAVTGEGCRELTYAIMEYLEREAAESNEEALSGEYPHDPSR